MCVLAMLAQRDGYAYDIASRLADGYRHGRRHDLSADAAHAGRRAGQDLSRGIEQRPAAQVLPADAGRPCRARRAARRVEQFRDVGRQGAVRRPTRNDRERLPEQADDPSRIPRRSCTIACAACRRTRSTSCVDDYASHFAEGLAEGRSEAEIAAALGDPAAARARAARRGRPAPLGDARARRPTSIAAMIGFLALIAVDFVFLLPLLGGAGAGHAASPAWSCSASASPASR